MMTEWKSQSRPGHQALLSLVCAGVGLLLVLKFGVGATGGGQALANARAGMGLGALLLVIGVASLATSGRQTVIVDPKTRRITVEDVRVWGTKSRFIPFGDIVSIRIGYLGKTSSFVQFYYLLLLLEGGEEYPLFSPGRGFDGGTDRFVVEGWRRRLEEYLKN